MAPRDESPMPGHELSTPPSAAADELQYCHCGGPEEGFMIECEGECENWFHGECVDIGEEDDIEEFFCDDCESRGHGPTVRKGDIATSAPAVKAPSAKTAPAKTGRAKAPAKKTPAAETPQAMDLVIDDQIDQALIRNAIKMPRNDARHRAAIRAREKINAREEDETVKEAQTQLSQTTSTPGKVADLPKTRQQSARIEKQAKTTGRKKKAAAQPKATPQPARPYKLRETRTTTEKKKQIDEDAEQKINKKEADKARSLFSKVEKSFDSDSDFCRASAMDVDNEQSSEEEVDLEWMIQRDIEKSEALRKTQAYKLVKDAMEEALFGR